MEKIKTVEEYQQLASRTCPDLGSPKLNLRHMQMGIITEVGETIDVIKKFVAYGKPLDIVNIGEEIADTIWYKANEAKMAGITWKQEEFEKLCGELDAAMLKQNLEPISNEVVDAFIVSVLPFSYGNTEAETSLKDVVTLSVVSNFYGLDFFQILTNNINKLKIRYPEKFTNEAALNRDLDAERVELEK
jgi:NTP pyrophosphatase (non-canonical NTP hydrolase)